jgi:estrogen-related receptor beta like 1
MWENSLEKLKIMDYENQFCKPQHRQAFNRVHFVFPGVNSSHQFDDFIDICQWLSEVINRGSGGFKKEEYDDPNTVANKLMLFLRQMDFRLSFPSSKLKTPYGEPVCSVIEFLCDKALTSRGFKWGTPVYTEADEVPSFCIL